MTDTINLKTKHQTIKMLLKNFRVCDIWVKKKIPMISSMKTLKPNTVKRLI